MAKRTKKAIQPQAPQPVTVALEKVKQFKRTRLKVKVQNYLRKNYDWKVSRALSTGDELTESDKLFRETVIAEFNRRMEFLESANTIEELNKVRLTF